MSMAPTEKNSILAILDVTPVAQLYDKNSANANSWHISICSIFSSSIVFFSAARTAL